MGCEKRGIGRNVSQKKTGKTKTDAKKFLGAFVQVVTKTLAKGEEVNITGFGRFYIRERSERVGRNPRTEEQITIPAGRTPAFSAGKSQLTDPKVIHFLVVNKSMTT